MNNRTVPVVIAALGCVAPVFAQDSQAVNAGDTAFVMISAALVMLMTPGLAFFYGGLVRKKNVLGVLMQCFVVLCVISLQWVFFGYSLSFAPGDGFWGDLRWLGLRDVGAQPNPEYAATIPHQAFMLFQAMFAVITPALIIGAFAERMKFSAFLIFAILWSVLVYDPVCHWVWGSGGWLKKMGLLDFAGGTVVHINAGVAALVTALVIGRRKGHERGSPPPHNLPFAVLGAGLLWFGWFGFNAGSALAANGLAASAFTATHTAAAAGGCMWAMLEWIRNGKPTLFGSITGAVAGLATVTPAAGYVTPGAAAVIGFVAGVACFVFVSEFKPRLGLDDSLDAFGVHGIGGILGTLAAGFFATTAVNPAGANGLFHGNPHQLWVQTVGVLIIGGYSFVGTLVIYKTIDWVMKVRVNPRDEEVGLDLTQHHEAAYTVLQ